MGGGGAGAGLAAGAGVGAGAGAGAGLAVPPVLVPPDPDDPDDPDDCDDCDDGAAAGLGSVAPGAVTSTGAVAGTPVVSVVAVDGTEVWVVVLTDAVLTCAFAAMAATIPKVAEIPTPVAIARPPGAAGRRPISRALLHRRRGGISTPDGPCPTRLPDIPPAPPGLRGWWSVSARASSQWRWGYHPQTRPVRRRSRLRTIRSATTGWVGRSRRAPRASRRRPAGWTRARTAMRLRSPRPRTQLASRLGPPTRTHRGRRGPRARLNPRWRSAPRRSPLRWSE